MSRRRPCPSGPVPGSVGGVSPGYGRRHVHKVWHGTGETRLRMPCRARDRSDKPMVKPAGVQRESEGVVVPVMLRELVPDGVQHNAPGGKGPALVMPSERVSVRAWPGWSGPTTPAGRAIGPVGSSLTGQPSGVKVRELQRRLWAAAKQSEGRRFHALYDRVHRGDVLWEAWKRVRGNRGAAGVDRVTLALVEDVRGGADARRTPSRSAFRVVSSRASQACGHPETSRRSPTVGDPHGAGPGGPGGGEDRAGTYLRGRLLVVLVRVPAQAVGDAGHGDHPGLVHPGVHPGGRGRYPGLLRQYRP